MSGKLCIEKFCQDFKKRREVQVNYLFDRLRHEALKARSRWIDDFIFIHINKTAGSSVEKILNLPFEHMTALEKIEQIGQASWERKYKFAVVRNPWDKVVSHYHYRVQTNQTNLKGNAVPFNEWVKLTYGGQDLHYYDNPKMFMPQLNWISNEFGEIIVDDVIRFETLRDGFSKVCKKIGKNVELPHVRKSNRDSYVDYYDDSSKDVVEKWFEQDIKKFNYKFGEAI